MANRAIQFKVPSRKDPPAPYDFPEGFAGGMNTRFSPDLIASNQSPDMLNMNYDDGGIPTKRLGIQRFLNLPGGVVRGMKEVVINNKNILLISVGGKLYEIDDK